MREEELSFLDRVQSIEIQYVVVLLLYTIFLVCLLSPFRQINALQDEDISFLGSFDLTRLCDDLLSRAWRAHILLVGGDKLIDHLSRSALVQQVLNLLSRCSIGTRFFYRWKETTNLGVFVLGGLRNSFFDLREYQDLFS